jgi:recombination protein RecA
VAEFDIMYDEGISKAGDLLDIAAATGIVDKRGSYFYLGEELLAQGRENAKQALRDDPDAAADIESKIRARMSLGGGGPPSDATTESEDHGEAEA